MRSLACTLVLAGLGLGAFFVAIASGLPRPQLSALIAASLLISALVAFIQFRFIERRCPRRLQAVAATAWVVIAFVACWQVLWAASEEFVIWKSIANGQVGDDGARWLYPGMSGMGNADGLTRPGKMLETLLLFGGGGAFALCFPFAWLLTAFKKRPSEQGAALQPAARAESNFSPSLPPST